MPKPTTLFFAIAMSVSTASLAATYPTPHITGFSPASGAPGSTVTLTGSGFSGVNAVWIGNGHDATVIVVNDGTIKATVPNDATTANIGVLNPQYSTFYSSAFTVTKGTGTKPPVSTPTPPTPPITVTPPTGPTGASYTISGIVSGAVSGGVTMTLNGVNIGSVTSDQGGSYEFSGLAAGTYTVSALLAGHTFSPAKIITLGSTDFTWNYSSSTTPSGYAALSLATVATLPSATIGQHYSSTAIKSIAGGNGNYHYQTGVLASGHPPLGMILNPNGMVTGTPHTAGNYTFTICGYDTLGHATAACGTSELTVVGEGTAPPVTTPPVTTPPVTTPPVTTPPVTTPPVTTPPVTTPPASGTSWVYYNGTFDWPGDYSYVASPNYGDTSGSPLSGSKDIKITLESAYGGWLPYAQNWAFNSRPYTKLTFALKPTVNNQRWAVFFVKVGDVPVGITLNVADYGPAPQAGKWATYTIPLANLGVLGTTIYKFSIQDQTGLSSNSWYVDNVGFVP